MGWGTHTHLKVKEEEMQAARERWSLLRAAIMHSRRAAVTMYAENEAKTGIKLGNHINETPPTASSPVFTFHSLLRQALGVHKTLCDGRRRRIDTQAAQEKIALIARPGPEYVYGAT